MAIDIANPGANEAALEAALVQRLPPARLPWVSGRSYGPANVLMVAHAPDYGPGYIFATPILIPNAVTIASLAVYVSTFADATTQTARIGIAADNNGIPSQTLLAEGMTELDLTQPVPPIALPDAVAAAGWHWLMLFISEAVGGAATGAELYCLDPNDSICGTGFEIGAVHYLSVLNDGLGSLSPAVVAYTNSFYPAYATLQEALTDIGAGWDANTSGYYFPAIAVMVA